MTKQEKDGLAICKEAKEKGQAVDYEVAEIIYTNLFARDGNYRNWKSASYQAPETREGFAFHICVYTAVKIREASEGK